MRKSRVNVIKEELANNIEAGEPLSAESAQELLDLLERIYPNSEISKDPAPMIGNHSFERPVGDKPQGPAKDLNASLNYRVNRFDEYNDEEN
jgi:hypothetical protein